jgi:hypothetical protein
MSPKSDDTLGLMKQPLAFRSSFGTQMPIHPREDLITSVAPIIVRMQPLMPLAIVLSRKAFTAARPLAPEQLLLTMRSYMTFQI